MAAWSDLLGKGSVAEQLLVWGVANQILGDLLGPALELVSQAVNEAHPELPNTPADLADMVVRGAIDQAGAEAEAAKSGINRERFDRLIKLTGEPIGLEQVLEAFRRGLIGWDDVGQEEPSVERAIKTARYYNYWGPVLRGLADVPITVGEAVDAYIRGQLPEDEAMREAGASGINPFRFQVLANAAGRPPSLTELLELKRRKKITDMGLGPAETTFQQGIAEGDTKNKWLAHYLELAEYLPPPRTITTLLKTGSITDARAQELWQDAGMTPELSAAYAKSARGEKLAGTRQLAESAVLTLYETQALSAEEATGHLVALGYDTSDVAMILELADFQRELKYLNSAITRIHTLYVGHKITRPATLDALAALGVVGTHLAHLMHTWDLEMAANVKLLTQAEVTAAFEYQVMTQDEATTELLRLGYTPFDAWVLLSNKAKGPLPGKPPQGPPGPGVVS